MPEQQDNRSWEEAERRIAEVERADAPELDHHIDFAKGGVRVIDPFVH